MNNVYRHTPSVTVLSNRGLSVREIQYHRHPDLPETTDERITRHQYDHRGFLTQSIDPRLSVLQQTNSAVKPNFTYLTSLSGTVLHTESTDAGTSVTLNDVAGRTQLAVTGFNDDDRSSTVTHIWQYEDNTLPGRALSLTEQTANGTSRITERFVWADNTQQMKELNMAGQCVSHYDTAGLVQTNSIALNGVPLSVTRRMLKAADDVETVADWQGKDTSVWNAQLNGEEHVTLTTTDATGTVLTITDASGNVQRIAYDVTGLLKNSWLTLKGGKEQPIVVSLIYSAAGQKLREEHGNGVVTIYSYEPQTLRLTGIRTERPDGHAAGAKVLQDLRYNYDPVGNVLSVRNDAEKTRFWRNQKVMPENTYTYDSLYQLVSATGREMANVGQQGITSPTPIVPLSTDSSAYTNYIRTYVYDTAGNLTQIRHSAPATNNNYTTDITVSGRNNRAVLSTLTENPDDVEALFSATGTQRWLQPGQALTWTLRDELLTVTPVMREGATDDSESYRYDADSQRILKMSVQKTGNTIQLQRVLYLPGLELRNTTNGSTEKEKLEVVTVGEAGRAQVRLLHWEAGKPADIPNDQLRYSYDNLLGSSGLEVDGDGNLISQEEYYPYGGTAVWTARSLAEVEYKTTRYSGKEKDATGLYYYGYRYYQPWIGRWLSADPAGTVDGLNLYQMVKNNPVVNFDGDGRATLLSNAMSGLAGIIQNGIPSPKLPSWSPKWPSWSPKLPSLSWPSLPSLSSISFSDINPLAVLKFIGKKIYKYTFKWAVKRLFKNAKSDADRVKYARWAKAAGIGIGLGASLAGILMTAGAALPVILGGAAAATLIGGGIGYFSGKISSAFSRLLHKAPGPTSLKAAGAAQFGNFISGGTAASAINTAVIGGVTDGGLKALGRSSEIRVTTGGEIGVAAGTDVQLNAGKPGKMTQYTAPAGVGIASVGAESFTDMEGIGELSAASAYEGAKIGKGIDKALGFTGGNLVKRGINMAVTSIAGIDVVDHPAEFLTSAAYAGGKSFLEVRTRATNNFSEFRNPSFD
ncbi:RHS repeat protein [Xenorhabdus sp. XENO-1]|uniref:RHS repeat domain-containing protein n=1 Tax=Xenorhabdus bovienii TaxID=40576 RepID=UPI0020CA335C|nr:RHS repeat domain-containing protein [Xenorhabdus bovienii]MCP9266964.1 RHS repeat protein [Xenorhabdus bovienii subsp. africana]